MSSIVWYYADIYLWPASAKKHRDQTFEWPTFIIKAIYPVVASSWNSLWMSSIVWYYTDTYLWPASAKKHRDWTFERPTFIIKAIYPVDTSTFMIAPQNEKVFWVFYLVCEEKANCFQGLLPSVHIIAEEEVICLWWESTILK
jgi:hypothetical protein